jgi:hypothetical protein
MVRLAEVLVAMSWLAGLVFAGAFVANAVIFRGKFLDRPKLAG